MQFTALRGLLRFRSMNRLRDLREQRQADEDPAKWTQEAIAERLGTTSTTVRNWEHGRAVPRPFYRKRLAKLYGVAVTELGLDDEP